MNKKGQIMGLSFQMIFSIILIAVFLYVAFIGIKALMNNANALKAADFVSELKSQLESAILKNEISQPYKYDLPSSITHVCFTSNASKMNDSKFPELIASKNPYLSLLKGNYLFFYPTSNAKKFLNTPYAKIDCEHSCLNLSSMKNPYCIENKNGVLSITLSKEMGQPYVLIK